MIRKMSGLGVENQNSQPVPCWPLWTFENTLKRGAWVAQSVKHLTSARVMISQLVGSRPTLGSVLTARSLEPAWDSVCVSLSLCPSPAHTLSLSLSLKK